MASLDEQMRSLGVPSGVPDSPTGMRSKSLMELLQEDKDEASYSPWSGALDQKAADMSRGEAMRFAATLGVTDTFRGVKQIAGFDKLDMATDQKLLNKLMENPEWGSDIKWSYFGSLLLDPVGWLTPASKVAQLARAGYKFTKMQKARKLAVHGAKWGGIGGLTGYVDQDSSDRVFNTITGIAGGAILAPALGVPGAELGKFLSSKTPEQLTSAPKEVVKELTGAVPPSLTNHVKTFYYGKFQPALGKYEELKKNYVYKPIMLDNPIASTGAAAGALSGSLLFSDNIDEYIDRLENERDLDSGPWRNALKATLALGAGAAGFGILKKGKFKGQTYQDFIGRRVIENYKLSGDFSKLKTESFLDFNDASYRFTDIAERAKALDDNEKKILYYFLDGQTKDISDLSKEAQQIGGDARKIIQETGQKMVDAGMLDPVVFSKNIDSYIHRTYVDKITSPGLLRNLGIKRVDEDTSSVGKPRYGLIGAELKPRGHLDEAHKDNAGKIADLKNKGYEELGELNSQGMQTFRLDLTKAEREAMNEIEDAAWAIKSTGDLMLNDLAVYKFYSDVNIKFGYMTRADYKELLKKAKNAKTPEERVLAQNSINEYKKSGKKLYDNLSPEEQAGLQQMNSKLVDKTGGKVFKYGDLAGKYLPKDMVDDIRVQRAFSDGEGMLGSIYNSNAFQAYRRYNAIWKRTKTSWNPTVHTNNIVSNFFLLDIHDVPLDTFLEHGLKVYTKKGQESLNKLDIGFGESRTYEDLVRLGVFDAGLAKAELRIGKKDFLEEYAREFLRVKLQRTGRLRDSVEDMNDVIDISTNIAGKTYRNYTDILDKLKIPGKGFLKNPVKWADKGATDLYQREDQMFRIALYIDRLQKRAPEIDQLKKLPQEAYDAGLEKIKREAAEEAKKGFIDYNIQAPFINLLRDSALPFFSYTYRMIPMLAKTATMRPSKFAKWAAVGYALDYAGRERSKSETEYERALMKEKQLSRMFGIPFMPPTFFKVGDPARGTEQFAEKRFDYTLGWGLDRSPVTGERLPERSFWLDIMRFIPGGDVLGQLSPEDGGWVSGLPAPFQPSGGLAGEVLVTSLLGIDTFTGKDITTEETFLGSRNAAYTLARLVPNNPLLGISGLQKLFGSEERSDFYDSWSHKKIMNSLERRPDSSAYAVDLPVLTALAQTVGIKIWPVDPEKLDVVRTSKFRKDVRDLRARIRKMQRDNLKYFDTPLYDVKGEKVAKQARELQNRIDYLFLKHGLADEKRLGLQRRERKFGEVPTDVLESLSEAILGTDN